MFGIVLLEHFNKENLKVLENNVKKTIIVNSKVELFWDSGQKIVKIILLVTVEKVKDWEILKIFQEVLSFFEKDQNLKG